MYNGENNIMVMAILALIHAESTNEEFQPEGAYALAAIVDVALIICTTWVALSYINSI